MESITIGVHRAVEDSTAEKRLQAQAGQNLLETLRAAGLVVPALCGGRGRCGSCRVRLLSGELEPSVDDMAYFSASELAGGWHVLPVPMVI